MQYTALLSFVQHMSSFISSGLAVQILSAENVSTHTEYVLSSSIAGKKYPLVRRRYREFSSLWKELQPVVENQGECLPNLAPKKMFGQMDAHFVKKRMAALQDALDVLCYLEPAAKSNRLRSFLGLPLFSPPDDETPSANSMATTNPSNRSANNLDGVGGGHQPHPNNTSSTTQPINSQHRDLNSSHHTGEMAETQRTMQGHRQSSAEHGLCSVGMIRHSARLDEVFGCTWSDHDTRPYDTPISDYDLPTRAASKLISYDFQAVVSSPFRRCLQTAAIVANRLGLKVLFVDNRLGEVMHQVRSAIAKQIDAEKESNPESGEGGEGGEGGGGSGGGTRGENSGSASSDMELRWQYMSREEAERIAEDSGLLLRWQIHKDKPPLNETAHVFIERCNTVTDMIEDAQASFDVHLLMEELEQLECSIALTEENLANARETVARASEQLLATFCNTLGLGPNAASDRMYEIANEAEQNDMGFAEEDKDNDVLLSQLPVEVAYRDALATVAPLQRAFDATKQTVALLRSAIANVTEENTSWSSALVVTHADLLNQRLQHLEPNALYAPRCCGWFVEDPRTNVVLGMNDCDRIM